MICTTRELILAQAILLIAGALHAPDTRSIRQQGEGSEEQGAKELLAGIPRVLLQTANLAYASGEEVPVNPKPFPDCALVGSAGILRGKRLGPKIDAHNPVIRVNRIPTPEFERDFGKRTDVLFGNHAEADKGALTFMGPPSEGCRNPSLPSCFQWLNCSDDEGQLCPTTALIFRNPPSRRWNTSHVPTGVINPEFSSVARGLRFRGGRFASTGLLAFLTLLPACDKMTLYGFKGDDTADGHMIKGTMHSVKREHELYRLVGQGKLSKEDFQGQPLTGNALQLQEWLLRELNSKRVVMMPGNEGQ